MSFGKISMKLLLAGLLGAGLAACGGGDGGVGTGDLVLGGDNGGNTTTTVSGTFVDAPVNGLAYSGSPSGTTGVTGDNGTNGGFTVTQGDTVTFSLGGLTLGSSQAVSSSGYVVTPAELAGARGDAGNARAVRIARLLQSLDNDGNTGNGITITDSTRTEIQGLDSSTRDSMVAALLTGTNFDSLFGGLVDDLTAGNTAQRTEGDLVTAVAAEAELLVAVNTATGGGTGSSSKITPHATGSCPVGTLASAKVTVFGKLFPVCGLSDDVTSDVTLTNDHVYVLQSEIRVGDGWRVGGPTGTKNAVLTIEPGTQIFGYDGIKASLVITRGSRIQAVGTADMPIIMGGVTATGTGQSLVITDDPADLNSDAGMWGGLVLSGRGINNACTNGEVSAEAVENQGSRMFGCNNNADSSGTVEYLIIAESGLEFRTNQEVQGLTIEGAGSNTRINYLQIIGSEDDGIEWFGGAASASNIVINGMDDDGLDWDEGYIGTIQNALVIFGNNEGDKGIEADTAGPSFSALPESQPKILNLTIIGDRGKGGSVGLHLKEGTGGQFWRSAIVDYGIPYVTGAFPASTGAFAGGCIDLDNEIDTDTAFRDVIMNCANGLTGAWGFGVVDDSGLSSGADSFPQTFFTTAAVDKRDTEQLNGSINPNTLAIMNQGTAPNNPVAPPGGVNGNPVGNYYGAVDPAAANPDNNPHNGGPFWDGWTYRNAAVQGNLPPVNSNPNFHPLQAEIE